MKEVMIALLPSLEPLFLALLGLLSAWIAREIQGRVRSERMRTVLMNLNTTAIDVVRELEQTLVADLKQASADGKISPDELESLRATAKSKLKSYLGPVGVGEIRKVFGFKENAQLDALIASKIEAAVLALRKY